MPVIVRVWYACTSLFLPSTAKTLKLLFTRSSLSMKTSMVCAMTSASANSSLLPTRWH